MAAMSATPAQPHGFGLGDGFGRGFGVFHSYGWGRGTAGYGFGRCYRHPAACEEDDD
jgi:hypothetical protein